MDTKSLKARLQRSPAVLAPGVYDALTALIAERAGFEALYLSGGAVHTRSLAAPMLGSLAPRRPSTH